MKPYYVCIILDLLSVANLVQDYFDEEFDENKNCVRQIQMKELARENPKRCTTVSTNGSTITQWENCIKQLAKLAWIKCRPQDLEKEIKFK